MAVSCSGEKALMEAQRLQGQSPSHGNCGGLSKSSYLALPFYRTIGSIKRSGILILVHSDVEKKTYEIPMPPKNARRLQLGHQTIRASKAHLFRASASPPNVVACPRGCPRVQSPSKKRVETLTRGSLGGSGLSPLCHDGCVFFPKVSC